jgi:hypothetical protein
MIPNKFDNLQFKSNIMAQTTSALKKMKELNESKIQSKHNASYKEILVENKLINDLNFFNFLSNKYLGESAQEQFLKVITECIDIFNKLHMEVDIQPRFLSPALNYNSSISENAKLDIYKTYFEESINKQFAQPLFEGTLLSKYEKESKLLLESVINTDPSAFNKNTLKAMTEYAIFENIVFNTFSDIFIPEYNKKEINNYIQKQVPEYFEMFNENVSVLKTQFDNKINELTIMIAPEMFNESMGLPTLACKSMEKEITPDDIGSNIDPEAEVSGSVSATSCVGPIDSPSGDEGNIVADASTEDRTDVTVEPAFDITDPGLGSVDDAIGQTILTDPLEMEGLNQGAASLDPDSEIDPIDLTTGAEDINTSTNDGNLTDTPDLEIGEPYQPADQLPMDTSVDIDSIIDTLEQDRIDDHFKEIAQEPEEYISVPVEQSYTEESTIMDYRQFAGARQILF